MALDDNAYDNAQASSILRALRDNSGVRGNRDAINGNSYSSGYLFESVADASSVNVFLQNPSNSGVVLFSQATYRSTGAIRFHKIDSVTVDSAGTSIDADNRLISDGTSLAEIQYGTTYSGGNPWTEKVTGGPKEGGGLAPGEGGDFDIILQPGENVVYEATNTSGGSISITIDVDYTELDKQEINELVE